MKKFLALLFITIALIATFVVALPADYNEPPKKEPPKKDYNEPPKKDYNEPPKKDYNEPPKKDYNEPPKKDYNEPPKKDYYDDYGKPEIHVTSPGPGPWACKSSQAVSWWTQHVKSDEIVVVEIVSKGSGKSVFSEESKSGPGVLYFTVGDDWDVKDSYFAVVHLKKDKSVKGESGVFKIYKTKEYGYDDYEDKKKYY